jgi:hypothetical protein
MPLVPAGPGMLDRHEQPRRGTSASRPLPAEPAHLLASRHADRDDSEAHLFGDLRWVSGPHSSGVHRV